MYVCMHVGLQSGFCSRGGGGGGERQNSCFRIQGGGGGKRYMLYITIYIYSKISRRGGQTFSKGVENAPLRPLNATVCMYACVYVYVCMYVCMYYACMYVCMYVYTFLPFCRLIFLIDGWCIL